MIFCIHIPCIAPGIGLEHVFLAWENCADIPGSSGWPTCITNNKIQDEGHLEDCSNLLEVQIMSTHTTDWEICIPPLCRQVAKFKFFMDRWSPPKSSAVKVTCESLETCAQCANLLVGLEIYAYPGVQHAKDTGPKKPISWNLWWPCFLKSTSFICRSDASKLLIAIESQLECPQRISSLLLVQCKVFSAIYNCHAGHAWRPPQCLGHSYLLPLQVLPSHIWIFWAHYCQRRDARKHGNLSGWSKLIKLQSSFSFSHLKKCDTRGCKYEHHNYLSHTQKKSAFRERQHSENGR